MENEIKYFAFEHSEGVEVVVAAFAREAVNFFLNEYLDDLTVDHMIEFDGLKIQELKGEEVTMKREIYNEDTNVTEKISFQEIAKDCTIVPCVIVCPRY